MLTVAIVTTVLSGVTNSLDSMLTIFDDEDTTITVTASVDTLDGSGSPAILLTPGGGSPQAAYSDTGALVVGTGTFAELEADFAQITYTSTTDFSSGFGGVVSVMLSTMDSQGNVATLPWAIVIQDQVETAPVLTQSLPVGGLEVYLDSNSPLSVRYGLAGLFYQLSDDDDDVLLLSIVCTRCLLFMGDGANVESSASSAGSSAGSAAALYSDSLLSLAFRLASMSVGPAETYTLNTSASIEFTVGDSDSLTAVYETPFLWVPSDQPPSIGAASVSEMVNEGSSAIALSMFSLTVTDDSGLLEMTVSADVGTLTSGVMSGSSLVFGSTTVSSLDSILAAMVFDPPSVTFAGPVTISLAVTDGEPLHDVTETVVIVINAVETDPILIVGGGTMVTIGEEQSHVISISVDDDDDDIVVTRVSTGSDHFTFSVSNDIPIGRVTFGDFFVEVTESPPYSMEVTVTGLTEVSATNEQLAVVATGQAGSPVTELITYTILPMNDVPVLSDPWPVTVGFEDSQVSVPFSLTIVDDDGAPDDVGTVSVESFGTHTVDCDAALCSPLAVTPINSTSLEINGPLSDILTALNSGGLILQPELNFHGLIGLSLTATDVQGDSGPALVYSVTVLALPEGPVVTLADTTDFTADEGMDVSLNNLLESVTDDDDSGVELYDVNVLLLSCTDATLSRPTAMASVVVTTSNPDEWSAMGSLSSLISFVHELSFSWGPNGNGECTLSVSVTDEEGFVGFAVQVIHITPINRPPSLAIGSVPTGPISENSVQALASLTVSVSDSDDVELAVVVSCAQGTFSCSGNPAFADGCDTGSVSVAGNSANMEERLRLLSFVPARFFHGNAVLSFVATDGPNFSATETASIAYDAVYDAPTVTALISTLTVVEGQVTGIGALLQVVVFEEDDPSVDTTLTVTSGTLTLVPESGSGVSVTPIESGLMLSGNHESVTAEIGANLNFLTATEDTSTVTLTVTAADSIGEGTPFTATINVIPVNNEPVVTFPTFNLIEDEPSVVGANFVMTDPEDSASLQLTVTVSEGALLLPSGSTVGSRVLC